MFPVDGKTFTKNALHRSSISSHQHYVSRKQFLLSAALFTIHSESVLNRPRFLDHCRTGFGRNALTSRFGDNDAATKKSSPKEAVGDGIIVLNGPAVIAGVQRTTRSSQSREGIRNFQHCSIRNRPIRGFTHQLCLVQSQKCHFCVPSGMITP